MDSRAHSVGKSHSELPMPSDFACFKCGYSLTGLTVACCPECGFAFAAVGLEQQRARTEDAPRLRVFDRRYSLFAVSLATCTGFIHAFQASQGVIHGLAALAVFVIAFGLARACASEERPHLKVAYLLAWYRALPLLMVNLVTMPLCVLGGRAASCVALIFMAFGVLAPLFSYLIWRAQGEQYGLRISLRWVALAAVVFVASTALGLYNAVILSTRLFGL